MARVSDEEFAHSVFINCPFDAEYKELFDALVFAVHDCGFIAKCALSVNDGSQVRIDKIIGLIGECRLGIHDISRTELSKPENLPRFNMPLELGIFLGAKAFGNPRNRRKIALILDREKYRYQKFCSDIAGQDVHGHDSSMKKKRWKSFATGLATHRPKE